MADTPLYRRILWACDPSKVNPLSLASVQQLALWSGADVWLVFVSTVPEETLARFRQQLLPPEQLQQTVEEDNSVLAPAFQLQRMLRQRILGVRYWEQETLRRQTYFAGYDSGTTTSWDAIRDILAIKHRERLEEEERQRRLKEMEEEQRRQEKLQKELKFKEEMVLSQRPFTPSRRVVS